MPLAPTVKVTLTPAVTLWPTGWVVIAGATAAALTVSTALELVTEVTLFVATKV